MRKTYTSTRVLCNIWKMHSNPNTIRPTPRKRSVQSVKTRRIGVLAASICALLLVAPAVATAQAGPESCAACSAAQEIAAQFEARAQALKTRAASRQRAALRHTDPRTKSWPGPARQDAVSTIWTSGGVALAHTRRAEKAATAAQGAADIAIAARRAAGRCNTEEFCAPVRRPTPPDASACAAAQSLSSAQTNSLLARINATVNLLESDGRSCAAMSCPEADCAARAELLETAAFTQGMLGAAMGTLLPAGEMSREPGIPEIVADIATGALEEIQTLAETITSTGIDPVKVRKSAERFAGFEARLVPEAGPEDTQSTTPRPEWRATAARLALAGLRDGLGQLSMANNDGPTPAQWHQFALRVEKAVATLVRMDSNRRSASLDAAAIAGACELVDPRVSSALSRLSSAFNLAADCSIRSDCDAREAIERGTVRAAALLGSPVHEPQLEVLRALEEEAGVSEHLMQTAAARASPTPSLLFTRRAYQNGEAISLAVKTNKNRCLADGGLVALLADDAGKKPPLLPRGIDDLPKSPKHLRVPAKPSSDVLIHAPAKGNYMLAIYGSPSLGGARLATMPLRVTRSEPTHCTGWTGIWQTEFGRMVTVEHEDGEVTGSYRQSPGVRPGFVVGKSRNGQFDGIWKSEIGSGGTRLRLMGEGVFRGGWGLSINRANNGGRWSGICIASAPDDAAGDD